METPFEDKDSAPGTRLFLTLQGVHNCRVTIIYENFPQATKGLDHNISAHEQGYHKTTTIVSVTEWGNYIDIKDHPLLVTDPIPQGDGIEYS